MVQREFTRTARLLGEEAIDKLGRSRVAVFGIGGVGGHVAEALARSGVGTLDLIDDDKVCPSNINRQIIATSSSVGRYKVDVAKERLEDINPSIRIFGWRTFFGPETADQFDFAEYDYVVDAIDTVTGKLELISCAKAAGVPVISSMGAGNKLDPTAFEVADIYETSVCPLARVMRRECRKRGIDHLKVVYSREEPLVPLDIFEEEQAADTGTVESGRDPSRRRATPGSIAFVPSVAGLIIAGEVVRDLLREGEK